MGVGCEVWGGVSGGEWGLPEEESLQLALGPALLGSGGPTQGPQHVPQGPHAAHTSCTTYAAGPTHSMRRTHGMRHRGPFRPSAPQPPAPKTLLQWLPHLPHWAASEAPSHLRHILGPSPPSTRRACSAGRHQQRAGPMPKPPFPPHLRHILGPSLHQRPVWAQLLLCLQAPEQGRRRPKSPQSQHCWEVAEPWDCLGGQQDSSMFPSGTHACRKQRPCLQEAASVRPEQRQRDHSSAWAPHLCHPSPCPCKASPCPCLQEVAAVGPQQRLGLRDHGGAGRAVKASDELPAGVALGSILALQHTGGGGGGGVAGSVAK